MNFIMTYHFYQKEENLIRSKSLLRIYIIKNEYVVHIRNLKQALNHGLVLKKVHRVIKFNRKAWLKPYTDMNTKLRQKAKHNFEKDFFKLMDNVVLGKLWKMWENIEILNF